jgi:hypothetical protein
MSVALVSSAAIRDLRDKTIEVTATCSGNYVNTGTTGDVVDLSQLVSKLGQGYDRFGFPWKIVNGEVINAPLGYSAILVPPASTSTTPWIWGLRIQQTGTAANDPFNELANGAYPAGLLAPNTFTLRFRGPHGSC